MRSPASPDLPEFRVDHSGCAFQVTGLDFAGPLYVKNNLNNDKVYMLLLTCASSRAIHLELTTDMSIEGFLRGFKRFIARRGIPEIVINDNFRPFDREKSSSTCYVKELSSNLYYRHHRGGEDFMNALYKQLNLV